MHKNIELEVYEGMSLKDILDWAKKENVLNEEYKLEFFLDRNTYCECEDYYEYNPRIILRAIHHAI